MKESPRAAERISRKSDGRRIFSETFKSAQIGRVLRGEITLAELSRKLGIARSLLQRWKRNASEGADDALVFHGRSPRMNTPGGARYVRELQLLLGKQTVELAFLRAQLESLGKGRRRRSEEAR